MTEMTPDPTAVTPAAAPPPPPPPPPAPAYESATPAPVYGTPPPPAPVYGSAVPGAGTGQVGQIRGTGISIVLFIVTFGIYGLVWAYKVHDEMKRYSGEGLGGGIGLLVWWVANFVSAFLMPSEIEKLYQRTGQQSPVSAITGLWATLGALILVGPIVWFVKVNGALNEFWKSQGAVAA